MHMEYSPNASGIFAESQARAHECIEQLATLAALLDAADEQHNDDSLMQYMLFSRC